MFGSKKTKEFYIDLQDSRYYGPGDVIRGDVVLDVAKPIKINHIRVALIGTVQAGSNALTLFTRESQIASEPGGSHLLEAKSNRFPFELSIPGATAELPTSMKLGDGSTCVSYTLQATLKRAALLSTTLQETREISVVEKIDVSNPEYDHPVPGPDEGSEVVMDGTSLVVGIPKAAFVRGDMMPVSITVKCADVFAKANAIRVALIRRFYLFGKGRRELLGEENAREPICSDLIADEENNFTDESTVKLFVPPASPPTTGSSGRILRVDYVVQVSVDMNFARRNDPDWQASLVVQKELPAVIGTTPRADISIDDDEDEEDQEQGVTEGGQNEVHNEAQDETVLGSATASDSDDQALERQPSRSHVSDSDSSVVEPANMNGRSSRRSSAGTQSPERDNTSVDEHPDTNAADGSSIIDQSTSGRELHSEQPSASNRNSFQHDTDRTHYADVIEPTLHATAPLRTEHVEQAHLSPHQQQYNFDNRSTPNHPQPHHHMMSQPVDRQSTSSPSPVFHHPPSPYIPEHPPAPYGSPSYTPVGTPFSNNTRVPFPESSPHLHLSASPPRMPMPEPNRMPQPFSTMPMPGPYIPQPDTAYPYAAAAAAYSGMPPNPTPEAWAMPSPYQQPYPPT